jgi:hypothetical protein
MAYAIQSIASRIEWCRRQSTQACAPIEIAGWRAEAEGLQDALLDRDHTTQISRVRPECSSDMRRDSRTGARCFGLPRCSSNSYPPPAR